MSDAPKFVHLHTHTHYSLLNALPKIPAIVGAAKADGQTSLAMTDSGNLYGAIEFFKECKGEGIKPIIGIDAYVAPRTRNDKEHRIDNRHTRLILLAKNETGYKNLIKLITYSYLEGFYYKPRVDRELLEKYADGLIAISPSFSGDIMTALKNSDHEKAIETLAWQRKLFPDFYIEITNHAEIVGHNDRMNMLIAFAKNNNVPLVAAHDVYYLNPEDKRARDTLVAIQKNISIEGTGEEEGADFSFITQAQAIAKFELKTHGGNDDSLEIPEALENTLKIADLITLDIKLGNWVFPKIEIPDGLTPDQELRRIVLFGAPRRGFTLTGSGLAAKLPADVQTRVDYELGVIEKKGYAPYFLLVADLLRFARENGIYTNIRGSVSGSMVTYLSGITNIDPLEYEIPFERFLNPDRPSAPDIDMDFADDRRDEMVAYTRQKYGADKVAQIGTFGTMAARGAVRDVARALGYPYALGDRLAKLIPMGSQGFPMTIEHALEITEELKTAYDKEEEVRDIIDLAQKIEGCARHISVHAAGVVIAPTDLMDFSPLQYDTKGENKIITQYDMYSIEEAGLLKFDFLGLKNLSIIADTVKLVEKNKGIKLDMDTMPIDDKKTFGMLSRGETADTFQLNGAGMTKYLVDLKPTTIHDINAMVALYRPGPIQFIPEYISRKHNPERIKYLDPAMEEILRKTYGILVYQDDLLMMANKLAGYSWGEVDKFRKAVGKKIPAEMEAQKEKFIKGCVEHSKWPLKKAQELWTWIEPFAAYGFNKAHSVSYGRVAYQTAYLKANFPGEYMASVLTREAGDVEKVAESVAECIRMKIPVLPPDINTSYRIFTFVSTPDAVADESVGKILFGLGSIKNFGDGIAEAIIAERERGGKFKSLEDFLNRIHDKNLNKKSLEALIKCGAMDSLAATSGTLVGGTPIDRGVMLGNLEGLLAYNKEQKTAGGAGGAQDSLFSLFASDDTANQASSASHLRLDPAPAAGFDEKLSWEKELLGLYVSGHPLEKYRAMLAGRTTIARTKEGLQENMVGVISGIIEEVKEISTKKGDMMAFIKVSDFTSTIEVVIFPRTYKEHKDILVADSCISIKGKMSKRNDQISMVAEAVKKLELAPTGVPASTAVPAGDK